MTYMPRINAATGAHWTDLAAELDRWGEAGRIAMLWWRDDDAATASPRLAELLRLAGTAPLALAVIPSLAQADLADALRNAPSVAVLQHGWRHVSWVQHGKKNEYPGDRSRASVAAELTAGRALLTGLFGERALPVFVPPWNRFAPELLPLLPDGGVSALSTIASPRTACLPPGLASLDVHVDLTAWRGDRGFIGTEAALGQLAGWLRQHRLGATAAGPIGILTHHLVMDGATAAFLDCLGTLIGSHAAARWTNIAELLR